MGLEKFKDAADVIRDELVPCMQQFQVSRPVSTYPDGRDLKLY